MKASASSVSAARYRLEVQGYTDISVVKDGINAQVEASSGADDAFAGMSLDERIEFEQKVLRRNSRGFLIWHFLKTDGLALGLLALWAWDSATGAHPWSFGSILSYVFTVGFLALIVRLKIPLRLYAQLLEAREWQRWDEVDRIARRLRGARWFIGAAVPEYELLFSEAKALAGRGNLDAAIEKVRPLECGPALTPSLYYGLLAGVYGAGRDIPGQIAAQERSIALDANSTNARVDLAFTLALETGDAGRARGVLQMLDREDLTALAKPYFDVTSGLIALDSGDCVEAERLFGIASDAWEAFDKSSAPIQSYAWIIDGCRAVALRRLGRTKEAEALFERARPFLETIRMDGVLDRWNHS